MVLLNKFMIQGKSENATSLLEHYVHKDNIPNRSDEIVDLDGWSGIPNNSRSRYARMVVSL
jgi:hypothetical protein